MPVSDLTISRSLFSWSRSASRPLESRVMDTSHNYELKKVNSRQYRPFNACIRDSSGGRTRWASTRTRGPFCGVGTFFRSAGQPDRASRCARDLRLAGFDKVASKTNEAEEIPFFLLTTLPLSTGACAS